MKFKMGSPIPEELIAKRFEDEDGEIFVELHGKEDFLFRVTDGNRYYYKIEKIHMVGETLTLLKNSPIQDVETVSASEQPTTVHRVFQMEDYSPQHLDEFSWQPASSDTETVERPNALDEEPVEHVEWQEGHVLPDKIKPLCKKNEYGGYTLRYNKFLYLLNKNYLIDVKSPDANYNYGSEEAPLEQPETHAYQERVTIPAAPSQLKPSALELEVGDVLPAILRNQCEDNLGPGGGHRLTLGDNLYTLDHLYKITKKMKMKIAQPATTPLTLISPTTTKITTPLATKPLTVKEVLDMMTKTVQDAIKKHGIEAAYFIDTVLTQTNREILIRAINGDLSLLNDDTREAAKHGKMMTLQEKGFDLLKAIFIHELYIKSTLSGRGDKMKYFLSDMAAVNHDGTMLPIQDNLSQDNKIQLLKFFKDRAEVYADKTDIILRVYLQLRNSIIPLFKDHITEGDNIRFDAFLIAKLYEHTTRMDRGDGLTMIRLTRAILKYTKALEK